MDEKKSGFIHSVKVPRLYKTAAKIVQEVAEGGGSVKQLVFEKKHINVNALYALVSLTLQRVHEINFLFKRTQLLQKEPRFDPWLARILVTELLWGVKKTLPQNGCKPLQTISGYEQIFKSHLSDNTGLLAEDTQEKKPKKKPRYVRINTVLISLEEALNHFTNEGWIQDDDFDKNDYKGFLQRAENLHGDYFMIDIHVPNMLIFPSGTKFFRHAGYLEGWVILQDKASCLPVHILNPPPGSTVLDMCAAPGMKTTQLASVLNNQGEIYAVERDERRYNSLVKMVESSGATNIKTLNKDILQCSPEDFPNVEYILVDPSCSGSGMTDRIQFQEEQSNARLERLSGFQIKILRSAITKYPNAKKVVYSTCSVNPEENEDVVRQVLETNYLFKLVDARSIVKESWLNFGSSDFGKLGEYCLYAKPEQDLTNGFFVAVFERLKEGEKNEFFDTKLFNYKKKLEETNKKKEARFLERQKEFEKLYGPVGNKIENNNDHEAESFDLDYHPTDENLRENHAYPDTNNVQDDIEPNTKLDKAKKKKKKHAESETEQQVIDTNIETEIKTVIELNGTKKKKGKHNQSETENQVYHENIKKESGSCQREINNEQDDIKTFIEPNVPKKKKRTHKPEIEQQLIEENTENKVKIDITINIELSETKKKKRKHKESEKITDQKSGIEVKKEHSEKKHKHSEIDAVNSENFELELEHDNKKKKHKKQSKNSLNDSPIEFEKTTGESGVIKNETPKKLKKSKKYTDIILSSEDELAVNDNKTNTQENKEKKRRKHHKHREGKA